MAVIGKTAGDPLGTVTMGRTLDTGDLLFGKLAKSTVVNERKFPSALFLREEILQQVANEMVKAESVA